MPIRRPFTLSNPRPGPTPRPPATSAPDATPGSTPNPWDPVPKPSHGSFTPDGNAIYVESSGFEELKDRAVVSATIEFLDCGPLPPLLPQTPAPAPTNLAAAPLPPPATANSSSSAATPSNSFTPINPRGQTFPATPAVGRSSSSASSPSDADSEDSDSSPEYEPTTTNSSSRKRRCGGVDQPFRPRKRPNNSRNQPRHRNHVVLRLQIEGSVDVSLPGKRYRECCGVIVSVEESTSQDDRCYIACKPISYEDVTKSAAAAFTFDVLGHGGMTGKRAQNGKRGFFTLRDLLRVCEEGGLLPFRYASLGTTTGGDALEVGCRDWITQLFCRLHRAGYVSWHASDVYPEILTSKGFPAAGNRTSFAKVTRHRYSGIRKQGNRIHAKYPYVEPSRIIPGHFALDASGDDEDEEVKMVRWEEYDGEELGYRSLEDMSGDEEEGSLRRSPRLAEMVNNASSGGETSSADE